MTEPRAIIKRLSDEFDALSRHLARVSGELAELDRVIAAAATTPTSAPTRAAVVPPAPPPPPPASHWQSPSPIDTAPAPAPAPAPHRASQAGLSPSAPRAAHTPRDSSWIGKLLAVAGVAVTLVGVALLLVLAAKADLLGPQIRVVGGATLSVALVAVASRLCGRPGGRIGAIALAATGVAAAYLDVIAVTTVYQWVAAPAGLIIAAVVGGAGLALARRWDSEHLGLLVLVPMIGLAPTITGGIDLLLIAFMLALSAAALPVQVGKDWIWMYAARIAVPTVPLLVALVAIDGHDDPWLMGGACGVAAILAIGSALVLLPATSNAAALALLAATGTLPVLAAATAVDRVLATLLAATLAAAVLALVLIDRALPRIVAQVWSALAAVATLIAVTVACHGYVQGLVLLALAVIVAVAGRRDTVGRWAAAGFGIIGAGVFLGYAPPSTLATATAPPAPIAVSTLAASLLVTAYVIAMARACISTNGWHPDTVRVLATAGGMLIVYAITTFTVTVGVLVGGTDRGFLAGHMAATICWIAMAAGLFVYALRLPSGQRRAAPVTGGLALTAAATAKLFLFDLGTLEGIYRVTVFIVVGLVLLGMGAGYARSLAQRDRKQQG